MGLFRKPNKFSRKMESFCPRAVYVIICVEFLARFSVYGLRSILALYLQNVLLLPERLSITVYHGFVMASCVAPLIGAFLADGFLGKFRTMVFFSWMCLIGKLLMCASSTPLPKENQIAMIVAGLALTSIGVGGHKPCSVVFLGDQFRLPRQQESLERCNTLVHFVKNLGAILTTLVTPLLRQTVSCFGAEDCYLVAFCFTTLLFSLAHLLFILGKPLYRLKNPKQNAISLFIKSASYALWQKLHSKHRYKGHWLDYATGKYDLKLVEDMKVMFSMMLVFVPLPIFWSLFDQQGSRWIFQVSRMDCRVLGRCVMPDQVQVISPALVLILSLFYTTTLLPLVRRHSLASSLWGLLIGGFLAGLAFIAAGVIELNLEVSYSSFPRKGEAFFNVINKLPCSIDIDSPFSHFQQIDSHSNYVYRNITMHGQKSYNVMVAATQSCGDVFFDTCWAFPTISISEVQVSTLLVIEEEGDLRTFVPEPDVLQKCTSRDPRLRVLFLTLVDGNTLRVSLTNAISSYLEHSTPHEKYSISRYFILGAGRYLYKAELLGDKNSTVSGSLTLQIGEVYSLVLQQSNSMILLDLYDIPPVNPPSVLWLLPQYVLMSVAEVVFISAGVEFTTSQAPRSMKIVTLALWYLTVAVGNLIIIIVTYWQFSVSQAHEFFFFAGLSFVGVIFFAHLAMKYKFVTIKTSSSISIFSNGKPGSHQHMAASDFSIM